MYTETEPIDCAAALVTAALEDPPDRELIQQLIYEAWEAGYSGDLTAALALGFAANVEAIAAMISREPKELWQYWCQREAELRTPGRPWKR